MNEAYTQLESRILTFLQQRTPAESDFNACALDVYRFQRQHNQPYDNYCKSLGATAELEDWRQIPAVPQSAFKQFALRAFPESETVKTFRTSGTTGEGFGSHHFCSLRLYDEAIARGWQRLLLPKRPFYFLSQAPADAPHSSLVHMFGVMSEKLAGAGGSAFLIDRAGNLNMGKLEAHLHVSIRERRPVALLGTALAFLNLFERWGHRGFTLPPGCMAFETGGYKGSGRSLTKTELHTLFMKHLGIASNLIFNEYGMTELSSQFYTRGAGNPHEGPPWARALVIDPETGAEVAPGGTGVLRIFDLANLGSVLAIQTQDLAIRRETGFELIGRDPAALPRGCSRSADEMLSRPAPPAMTTLEIAESLAAAAQQFPLLGEIGAQDLLDVVKWELGHEEILDGFQPYAAHRAMARGPRTILHIISGNTPHAGLQSLMRGLLLKSRNLCKIPSAGLPEIAQFRDALPDELKTRIEISPDLPAPWLEEAEAIIAFGDDTTIEHFRRQVRPGRIYIAHGHKVSLGIVFDDPRYESVSHAARDASLHDQQGCLSPHVFYVAESGSVSALQYAERLAREMEKFNSATPRSAITPAEAAAINAMRADFEFRAANNRDVRVWKSAGGTDWTVIFDTNARFTPSPLNRVIFVKPLPARIDEALADARAYLSAIAIWPATLENARHAATLGATRICEVGRMQEPKFTWHQDGGQNLAPLVRWIDFEDPARAT